jgi:hypothetical protein
LLTTPQQSQEQCNQEKYADLKIKPAITQELAHPHQAPY